MKAKVWRGTKEDLERQGKFRIIEEFDIVVVDDVPTLTLRNSRNPISSQWVSKTWWADLKERAHVIRGCFVAWDEKEWNVQYQGE